MISSYEFGNLLGTFYKKGNMVFSEKRNILFSPIGNKVKVIDLESNTTSTLNLETRSDISNLAISPDSKVLVAVDVDGYALIINLITQHIVSHFNFKGRLRDIKFSPNGKFLACCSDLTFKIYEAPTPQKSFESMHLYKKFKGRHSDVITSVEWSPDSRFLITTSKDLTVILHNIHRLEFYETAPFSFSCNKMAVRKAFFSQDMKFFFTIDKGAVMCVWKWVDDYLSDSYKKFKNYQKFKSGKRIKIGEQHKDIFQVEVVNEDAEQDKTDEAEENDQQKGDKEQNKDKKNEKKDNLDQDYTEQQRNLLSKFERQAHKGRFILIKKHNFFQPKNENSVNNQKFSFLKINRCVWHSQSQLLVVAFNHGNYGLYRIQINQNIAQSAELQQSGAIEIIEIQTFQLSKFKISSLAINASAAWIALGVRENGQLIVWEWRSQSQILNQQCLSHDVHCVSYSQDGSIIATGGVDGRIRLWHTQSYLCFASIQAHEATVTGLVFSNRSALITSSLDGSVHAIDIKRCKSFRTLKPDVPTQLTCISVDQSGEVICAAGIDPYDIYCWNLQTGTLLEVIGGHTSPVQCLQFVPNSASAILFSASWDKTVRIHDIFSRKLNTDVLQHTSEITALAVRGDGKEICVGTLKGELYLWDVENAQIIGNIDIKRDLTGGRGEQERFTSAKSQSNKHFRSLVYSSDGDYVLGCGNSKFVCLYELKHRLLIKKFKLSNNRSLDGILHKLNSKNINDIDGNLIIDEKNNSSESEYEERKDESLPGAKKRYDTMKRNIKQKIEACDIKFSPTEDTWSVAMTEGLIVFSKKIGRLFQPYQLDENITIESIIETLSKRKDYAGALSMALQLNSQELIKFIYLATPQQQIPNVVKGIETSKVNSFLSFIIDGMLQSNGQVQFHFLWIEEILFQFRDYLENLDLRSRGQLKLLLKLVNQKFTQISKKLADDNLYNLDYIISNLNFQKLQQQLAIETEDK